MLSNIALIINGTNQLLLPSIYAPLTLTVADSLNRLDTVTSLTFAENIRIALAAIQHFYSIDVNLYQDGAQSLLGRFHREIIYMGSFEYNFLDENIFNFSSISQNSGNWNLSGRNFSRRFNLRGGITNAIENSQYIVHRAQMIRSILQIESGQTNDFSHWFGSVGIDGTNLNSDGGWEAVSLQFQKKYHCWNWRI